MKNGNPPALDERTELEDTSAWSLTGNNQLFQMIGVEFPRIRWCIHGLSTTLVYMCTGFRLLLGVYMV